MSYHRSRFGQFDLRSGGSIPFTPTEVSSRESTPMPTGSQEYSAGREMQVVLDPSAFQQPSVRDPIPQQTEPVALPARQPVTMEPIVATPYEPIVRAPSVPTPRVEPAEARTIQPSAPIIKRGAPVIAPMPAHPIVGTSMPTAPITHEAPPAAPRPQPSGPVQSDCPPGYYRPGARSACIPAPKPAPMLPMSPITTQAPPPTGPITTQGNPPTGPITTQAPPPTGPIQPGPALQLQQQQQYCAANKGTLDSQGCCHSPQGSFTVVDGVVQRCPGVPVMPPAKTKSPVVPIAIAAGAALLLVRML